jgi:hypothetical protein
MPLPHQKYVFIGFDASITFVLLLLLPVTVSGNSFSTLQINPERSGVSSQHLH